MTVEKKPAKQAEGAELTPNSRKLRFGFLAMCQPFTDAAIAGRLLALAKRLDESRFDAFFYVDHMFLEGDRYLAEPRDVSKPYQLECYTTLASVAAMTTRLRVGPLVSPIPMRHPAFVAKMGATIDVLSGGRFLLGAGTGWNAHEYEAYSLDFEKAPRDRFDKLAEGLEIIRALWTSDAPVTYDGRYYAFREAPFFPKPTQKPHPPIWLGGSGARTLDLVARLADGWSPAAPHYNAVTPDVYRNGWRSIQARAEDYGRDPLAITPAFYLNTAIAASAEAATMRAEAQHLRADWRDLSLEQMRASGVLAMGTPRDCSDHLSRYIDAGVRYMTVSSVPFTIDAMLDAVVLYDEEVIPRLLEAYPELA